MPAAMTSATLLSVNTARVRPVPWGQLKRSAIDKCPIEGGIFVSRLGLQGDEQADLKRHGGADQAVYAFAREDLDAWTRELGRTLPSGCFGENLTTLGIDVTDAVIGERWRIGAVVLEVTAPRIPCSVFQGFLGESDWMKRFTNAGNPGAYLRVLSEGALTAGDAIVVEDRPSHGVTISEVFRAKSGAHELVPRLLQAPQLSHALREWAERRLA